MTSKEIALVSKDLDTTTMEITAIRHGLRIISICLKESIEKGIVDEELADAVAELSMRTSYVNNLMLSNATVPVAYAHGAAKRQSSFFDILPDEVVNCICRYAMTAENGRIKLDNYSQEYIFSMQVGYLPGEPKNIGLALLRTCHKAYHMARDFLYSENELIFGKLGLDLPVVLRPLGLDTCVAPICGTGYLRPSLDKLTLSLGHDHQQDIALENMDELAGRLEFCSKPWCAWPGGLKVKTLTLIFLKYCWSKHHQPHHFARVLHNVRVQEALFIYNWNSELEIDNELRSIPKALKMSPRPASNVNGHIKYVLDMEATEQDWIHEDIRARKEADIKWLKAQGMTLKEQDTDMQRTKEARVAINHSPVDDLSADNSKIDDAIGFNKGQEDIDFQEDDVDCDPLMNVNLD
ncbi:hypothetical protein MMC06_000323 [Schaereria dolodes]|nr:hypothetical protein [Schaereria dolodes]